MIAIDNILEKYTTSKQLPLAIGAVVTRDKGLVYNNGYGFKRVDEESSHADEETVVKLFSTSKALTTTALLQLLESGKITSIDDPVEKYIPEIKDTKLMTGVDDEGKPILVTPTKKPTLRNLLTHTAGFSYSFFSHKYADYLKSTGNGDILKSSWEHFNTPFIYEPGTKFHYGVNIDWAGKVVENVSGLTLDAYCKKNIFGPLEANSLTFERFPEQFAQQAQLHQRVGPTDYQVLENAYVKKPKFHAGGHGCWGKVSDYMKFLEIFLHEGKSPQTGAVILKPETIQKYSFSNLMPEGVKIESTLEVSQPDVSNYVDYFDLFEKQGWTASFHKTGDELPTGRSANSFNWAGLANLYYWIDVNKGIAGFFATQLFPFYDKSSLQAFGEFETEAYKTFA